MEPTKEQQKSPKRHKHRNNPILRLREFYHLTRSDFAFLLEVSPWTIKQWENDRQTPSLEGWRRLKATFVELAMKDGRSRKDAVTFIDARLFPASDAKK